MSNREEPRPGEPAPEDDEELARLAGGGDGQAAQQLLTRYMQAIYWLPRRAFGAPEEELSGFLLYALDRIRERRILAKYDPDRPARFSTWFGVVLRNLYLDYLRARPEEPAWRELPAGITDAAPPAAAGLQAREEESLLERMPVKCRTIFKLLLCGTYYLRPEEVAWIARHGDRRVLEVAREIALLEERLRNSEVRLRERYDRLGTAFWWKTKYEREFAKLQRCREHPPGSDDERGRHLAEKLRRRQGEYQRLQHELAGNAGIVTAPYRELARILGMKEGSLASRISRCRAAATELFRADTGNREEMA